MQRSDLLANEQTKQASAAWARFRGQVAATGWTEWPRVVRMAATASDVIMQGGQCRLQSL